MAVPTTNTSLGGIQTEFGGSPPISISEYYSGGPLVPASAPAPNGPIPASGQISIGQFRGAVKAEFVAATGGTITTSGDYKIHTFNGPGTFTVTNAGNAGGSNAVGYEVVAGGGGAATKRGGGGGAGGYREATTGGYTASPLATPTLTPVSVTSYPITVGGGGSCQLGADPPGSPPTPGSNSVFSTITSTGGGASGRSINPGTQVGASGGSGGGSTSRDNPAPPAPGGAGNTPPTAPPQGQPGGAAAGPGLGGSGGGGAGAAGSAGAAGPGGNGVTSNIRATPQTMAGGGGGGASGGSGGGSGGSGGGGNGGFTPGTANTGGGGGGANDGQNSSAGNGGSGRVVIRYKFQ